MLRPVNRALFTATGCDGRAYPLRAYQMRDNTRDSVLGPPGNDPADWEYETSDARVVLRLGKGEYLLVDANTVLLADAGP